MSNQTIEKLNLDKFYEVNKEYEELKRKADEYYQKLKIMNSKLDLDEINEKCSYKEVKEIYDTIKYRVDDNDIIDRLKSIMKEKKETEYPEVLGVQYYPEIKEFNFLSEKFKVKLDKILREAYSKYARRRELHYLDKDVLDALINANILEKEYEIKCGCGSWECSSKIITETELNGYKEYWRKSTEDCDSVTDEEDEEFNYGCIEIPCWHDTPEEICSLEEFENYRYKKVEYKFIKAPNLELENL